MDPRPGGLDDEADPDGPARPAGGASGSGEASRVRWCVTCPRLRARAELDLDLEPDGTVTLADCSLHGRWVPSVRCDRACLERFPGAEDR